MAFDYSDIQRNDNKYCGIAEIITFQGKNSQYLFLLTCE